MQSAYLIFDLAKVLIYGFVLVREDYEKSKPHPEPYLKGVKQFGCKKEEVLIVEDSERGLNSAVAAGIECAIVYNEFTKSHDFSKATYKINSLSELARIFHKKGQTTSNSLIE